MSELAAAPGLSSEDLDTNGDGEISNEEIASRIRAWQSSGVGMMSHHLTILMDGQPLEGALLSLEPYSFLGGEVLAAGGRTDPNGTVTLSVEESLRPVPNVPTLHCGFYKIRISKKSGDQELIPSRYNSETSLGCEIAPDRRNAGELIEISGR